ncbi:uroporphyrinogen-III C-methyltransferase [Psychromonas hadalis]|uniref:uroporphyrinogen-III C-methyltransferase n=1 Tax=Psychromonas hadalis TaxID=211669 RepID=UPI0003B46130|nr:uroporphyrinogen-III C-methyltransferase [Psychromonas hadalis]
MTATENRVEHQDLPAINKQKTTKLRKLALFSGLFALILIVGCAVLAFTFYKENQALFTSQQQQLNLLSQKLTVQSSKQDAQLRQSIKIKTTLEAQIEQVTLQLQQTKNDNKIAKTDIQSLQRRFSETNIRHPNDWILSEVEYLIALASRKIWLEKDIKTAISLLVAADQRIVELNDASLSPLRSALLEDINSLETLPKRDPDGVILVLSSLERRVNKLQSTHLLIPDADKNSGTEVSTDINDWDSNLVKSWDAFIDSFITVNRRENKIEALLSPEQSWYLQEHLRYNLAKAGFAIYREQQVVYDIALENTLNLLKTYYDLNNDNTGHFYKAVQRLSKRKISIKYPDQLKSTPLLESVIEQRLKKSLASSNLK